MFATWLSILLLVAGASQARPASNLDPLSNTFEGFVQSLQAQLDPTLSTRIATALPQALVSFAQKSIFSPQQKAQAACQIFSLIFPNETTAPDNPAYSTAEDVNWSLGCHLPASCFVAPTNTIETQITLKVITLLGSKFAVRSGGHNPNPSFASIDKIGVLIDLKNLKSISLSPDNNVLSSGAGNRGQDLQSYTDAHGVSAVFGVNLVVGSSGLTLGGGYPILGSATGLPADNIQNFEVVLADSSVVNANAREHSDLWRSLRGGGNNFGIVTNFDRYTSNVHNIWYRIVNYAASDYLAYDKAFAQTQRNMKSDAKANVYVTASTSQISVVFAYAEPANDPAVFAPFKALTPVIEPTPPANGTIYSLAQIMSTPDHSLYYQTASVIVQVDQAFYDRVWQHYLTHAPFRASTAVSIAYKPFDPASIRYDVQKNAGQQNIMGHADVAQTWFGLAGGWLDPTDASYVQDILDDMESFICSEAQKAGLYLPNQFANDAGPNQDVMASYGAQNLALMKQVSRMYDPAQIFQSLQNGGFLVSKA